MNTFTGRTTRLYVGAAMLLVAMASFDSWAKEPKEKPRSISSPARVLGAPQHAVLNINNVTTWSGFNGVSNHSPSGDDGMYFPRGTGSVVYQDGAVWGGKVYVDAAKTIPGPRQLIRVGGGTYSSSHGVRAGAIINPANGPIIGAGVEDPAAEGTRIWRIRRDYFSMSQAELLRDAASVYEIHESSVTPTQQAAVFDQYATDWVQWPVSKGAPYIERNGVPGFQAPPAFGPTFTVDSLVSGRYDEPGVAGTDPNFPADQAIWTVYNDLTVATATSFEGSEPIGLEVQRTVWGYRQTGDLGNIYYTRYRMINKGGVDIDATAGDQYGAFWIDSMYVCQWSDPDLGNAGDDLIGCDTLQSLGYAYNGQPTDTEFSMFNLVPPSVGYLHVAGPLVNAPGDSGIFDLRRIRGKRNLGMSSFAYFSAGSPYSDPPSGYGNYLTGTGRWWKMLRGYAPLGDLTSADIAYASPPGMPLTLYPFSGDPVTGTGFVDGLGTSYSFAPGDRRILLTSGPFSMAPGDTNEFVMAVVAGLGADRLSSINVVRWLAQLSRNVYGSLWSRFPPDVQAVAEFPTGQNPRIALRATASNPLPLSVDVIGRQSNGTLLFSTGLFDDGAHNDDLAADGIFGGNASVPAGLDPLTTLEISSEYSDGSRNSITKPVRISLLPPPAISASVVSDNLNSNGIANRGENVRVGVAVLPTSFSLSNVVIRRLTDPSDEIFVESVGPAGGLSKPYDPADPSSYLSIDIPAGFSDSTFVTAVQITDASGNLWLSELPVSVEVQPLIVQASPVTKVQGLVEGAFGILRVDPTSIKNHTYRIDGSYDAQQNRSFITIRDLSAGGVAILTDHEVPDSLGHNMPVIDGFKIMRGTVVMGGVGLKTGGWSWTGGSRFLTWTNSGSSGYGFQEFSGAWGWDTPPHFFSLVDNRVSPHLLSAVRIVFAAHDTSSAGPFGYHGGGDLFDRADDDTSSYAYRYLRAAGAAPAQSHFAPWIINTVGSGYLYQDYRISVPLSAYNIDVNPPQRLAVAFLENNAAGGLVDGYYWPPYSSAVPGGTNTASTGPREWLWILNAPYGGPIANDSYKTDVLNDGNIPIMYWGLWNRFTLSRWSAGHSFTLVPHRIISSQDVWTFNPSVVGVPEEGSSTPSTYALEYNYPNPFNPSTTVRYALPVAAAVTIRVYNMLGQLVDTIAMGEQAAGVREVTWQADRQPSGLYVCRLDAKGSDGSEFTRSLKMLMVK